MFVGWIVFRQAQQLFLREIQVVELVLEDDARLEQCFLYDGMALGLLLVAEGYLRQIVLTVVGVVGQCVGGG